MVDLKSRNIDANKNFVKQVVSLVKERAEFVKDFWEQSSFFFEAPTEYDAKIVKKRWKENTPAMMAALKDVVAGVDDFKAENIKAEIVSYLEKNEISMGAAMNALRLVLVGGGFGPDLMKIAELLGKDEVIIRIEAGIENINK